MSIRFRVLMRSPGAVAAALAGLFALAPPAYAEAFPGLAPPPAEALWPQWQARVTVVRTAPSQAGPFGRWSAGGGEPGNGRGLLGGAVLGDYRLAGLGFGSLRASGGVRVGTQAGLPMALGDMAGMPQLGWSVLGAGAAVPASAFGEPAVAPPVPYLGLGFSGALWGSLSLSADLGYVAERPSATAGVGRALFGNQGAERSLRELRLSPVLQLGLRYAF